MRLNPVSVLACIFCVMAASVPASLCAKPGVSDTGFELYDISDKLYSLERVLADPDTRMVVVDFFSMSCAPCKRAMPRLSELQRTYAGDGLRVVVVAIPAGGDRATELDRVKCFFAPMGNTFPVVFDKYSVVARQYSVTDGRDARLPQSFVIGKDGKVVNHFEDMTSVIAAIESRFGKRADVDVAP